MKQLNYKKTFKSGIVLITTLLILTILFILATSFIELMSKDYFFSGHQFYQTKAFYLAKSGLTYYQNGGLEGAASKTIQIPIGDPTSICEINVDALTVTCRGLVKKESGEILGERIIQARLDSPSNWYEITR
ncbi:MAG: hypothetical protein HYU63_04845 [Armatimonadetes bacterium]|nr:hypothetical protein [Armatimonadota bacterium]